MDIGDGLIHIFFSISSFYPVGQAYPIPEVFRALSRNLLLLEPRTSSRLANLLIPVLKAIIQNILSAKHHVFNLLYIFFIDVLADSMEKSLDVVGCQAVDCLGEKVTNVVHGIECVRDV